MQLHCDPSSLLNQSSTISSLINTTSSLPSPSTFTLTPASISTTLLPPRPSTSSASTTVSMPAPSLPSSPSSSPQGNESTSMSQFNKLLKMTVAPALLITTFLSLHLSSQTHS